jgi:hypothetical protein
VPRVYSWSRSADGAPFSGSQRPTLRLGDFPAGSTLERVIFSYVILQDVFYGGLTAPPDNGWLAYGVVALPVSAGAPAFDPASSPAADWLFVGLGVLETQQLRFMSPEEYRVQLTGPKRPLETESRRHNGLAEPQRVWFVAQPVDALNSGFPVWRAITQGGVLYSELSP